MSHLVLIGDSTLDNAAYVQPGEDVTRLVRAALPPTWAVTRLALDGSVIADVVRQLAQLPATASHLIVSVGGNDAILKVGLLDEGAASMADALGKLARVREEFARDYRAMLDAVIGIGLPTAISTIYGGSAPDPIFQELVETALMPLNDCITREASSRGIPLIDLRVIFDRAEDYANPIEPSREGGQKLAGAIARLVAQHDFATLRSESFTAIP